MKIVVISPNVSENMSGEAIKAFQYINHLLADGADVSLLTHARSRGHVGQFPEGLPIHFIEDGFWQKFFWRSGILRSLVDIPFFFHVRKFVRARNAEAPGTVFHYLGPVSPITPRFPEPGAKCVLGPITGNIYYPKSLRHREPGQQRVRRIVHKWFQHLAGTVFNDKSKFHTILVSGGERTRQSLKWGGASDDQMRDVYDSGVTEKIMALPTIQHEGVNNKFVANGRLVSHKGIDLAIRATAETGEGRLDIFGAGPEEAALQGVIDKLGVGERVRLCGWLPSHDDLIREMTTYRAFVFPSMAEANGIVVQEALAMGLPVVCLNWGGPTMLTTEETAIRIDPDSEDKIVNGLAAAMDRLAQDPDYANKLAGAGVEKARKEFNWAAVSLQWRIAFGE